ncbi:MAG: XdhC family protein [Alphaproteobacteria bacterium]|jgi:xanthine dehydrogenase accessory factor|nr:XdhC family protein [Alphaproteobacteria bacterium]
MRREALDALLAARDEKRPLALATALDGSGQWLIGPDHAEDAPESIIAEARKALDIDQSRTVEGPDGPVFIQVHNPPWRMVVIGAVHITQPLAQMATLAGYEVTVVDPRGAFATAERFPGIDVSDEWPDEALERLEPDARTAVVTLTHDPKLDDAALEIALKSPAFYIGSLGSKKTHGARIERLTEEGFDAAALARINGPVGLALGAKSPAEIAVAILAQVIAARRQPAPAAERAA